MTEHQRPMTVSRGVRTQHTVDDYRLKCEDCGRSRDAWSPNGARALRALARSHAKEFGHSVTIQSIAMSVYQPEEYQQ